MTPRRLLGFLLLNFLIAGVALQYLSVSLYRSHRIPAYCDGTVIHPLHDLVSRYQETDSWGPMARALDARSAPRGIYQTVFFDQQTKFQYPLASLIPFDLLRRAGLSDYRTLDLMKWLSIGAFLAQIPCIYLIVSRSFQQPQSRVLRLSVSILLVCSFYPLVKAYAAGQIQIFLDLLFSLAFLAWIDVRKHRSGLLIGFSVLVKPQYGLFLLWAILRKHWQFVTSALVPVLGGSLLGLIFYGWRNNVRYLSVLSYMSRHGETYYPNQSFNGLFNRLLQNGSSSVFAVHRFAPYLPVVYALTLVTSLAIFWLAIFNKAPQDEAARISEFGLIGIAATAGSPIAWEHHYGVLLPVFAWLLPRAFEHKKVPGAAVLLTLAFVLCADDLRMTNLVAGMPPWNVIQSTLLCGAMILFFLLRGFVLRSVVPVIHSASATRT